MSWLICNVCLRRPANGAKSYNITSCFHLLCNRCITTDVTICTKCKQNCAIIQLNARTPKKIKKLFTDVTRPQISRLKRIFDVQKSRRNAMFSYSRTLFKKYRQMKALLVTNEKNANILWHKYQQSKTDIAELKRKLNKYEEHFMKYQKGMSHRVDQSTSNGDNFTESNLREMYYSSKATPRRTPMNVNSSVFISPESIASKNSVGSSSTEGCSTPFVLWKQRGMDPSIYATPKVPYSMITSSHRY